MVFQSKATSGKDVDNDNEDVDDDNVEDHVDDDDNDVDNVDDDDIDNDKEELRCFCVLRLPLQKVRLPFPNPLKLEKCCCCCCCCWCCVVEAAVAVLFPSVFFYLFSFF